MNIWIIAITRYINYEQSLTSLSKTGKVTRSNRIEAKSARPPVCIHPRVISARPPPVCIRPRVVSARPPPVCIHPRVTLNFCIQVVTQWAVSATCDRQVSLKFVRQFSRYLAERDWFLWPILALLLWHGGGVKKKVADEKILKLHWPRAAVYAAV